MQGMLEPDEVETPLGQAEVRQLFRASRIGTIAGSFVTEGKVTRGARVRVVRDGTVIYDTTIASLRRFNEDVREVASRLRVRHRARRTSRTCTRATCSRPTRRACWSASSPAEARLGGWAGSAAPAASSPQGVEQIG